MLVGQRRLKTWPFLYTWPSLPQPVPLLPAALDISLAAVEGQVRSYDAPVVKAHQFPQHFEFNAVGH